MFYTNVLFSRWVFSSDVAPIKSSIKRGLSDIGKFAITAYNQLQLQQKLPLVFSTNYGCQQQILKISEQKITEGGVSPACFSRVPNNIPAGLISIMEENKLPSTTISAGKRSFEIGLLEAVLRCETSIVYVYADEEVRSTEEVIVETFEDPNEKYGAFAVVISKEQTSIITPENSENIKIAAVSVETHDAKENSIISVKDFISFLEGNDQQLDTTYFLLTKEVSK